MDLILTFVKFFDAKKEKLDALKGFMRDTPIINKGLYWRLAYVIACHFYYNAKTIVAETQIMLDTAEKSEELDSYYLRQISSAYDHINWADYYIK